MNEEEIIQGCLRHERNAQRALFEMYGKKMMGVCIRFAHNEQEAEEILYQSFKNIFRDIRKFYDLNRHRKKNTPVVLFEEWLKRNIISDALAYLHKNIREYFISSTVSVRDEGKPANREISDEEIVASVNHQSVIKALQQLTSSQRAIFNLHEMEGYSHSQISKLLDISESASKDGFLKAKFNLRKNLCRYVKT